MPPRQLRQTKRVEALKHQAEKYSLKLMWLLPQSSEVVIVFNPRTQVWVKH